MLVEQMEQDLFQKSDDGSDGRKETQNHPGSAAVAHLPSWVLYHPFLTFPCPEDSATTVFQHGLWQNAGIPSDNEMWQFEIHQEWGFNRRITYK